MYVLERQWKRHKEEEELAVTSLPPKKQCRLLRLGKILIMMFRRKGLSYQHRNFQSSSKRNFSNTTRLAECGGPATLSAALAKSLLHPKVHNFRGGGEYSTSHIACTSTLRKVQL